jgi:hypothetical protein
VNAKNLAVSPTTWKSATWKSFSAYLTIQYNSWKWTAENKKSSDKCKCCFTRWKALHLEIQNGDWKSGCYCACVDLTKFPFTSPCRSDIVMKRGWGSHRQNLRRMHLASDKSTSIYEKQHPSKRKESFG